MTALAEEAEGVGQRSNDRQLIERWESGGWIARAGVLIVIDQWRSAMP
jgi:hypothetical protein